MKFSFSKRTVYILIPALIVFILKWNISSSYYGLSAISLLSALILIFLKEKLVSSSFWELQIIQCVVLLTQIPFLYLLLPLFVQDTLIHTRHRGKKKTIVKLFLVITLLYLELLFSTQEIPAAALTLIPYYACGAVFFIILKQEKKRASQNRKELKEKLVRRDELLSTLSHEVRTPLTIIQSSAEILQQERLGSLNTNQINFIDTLLDNIQRLISFTDTILSCIKVETDWFSLNLSHLDLRSISRDAVTSMTPFARDKNIEIRSSFPNLLSRPLGDRNWIYQVLINLIHNAIKHLPGGGEIHLSVQENEHYSIISVSDNGEGIPLDQREDLFNEFEQGNPEKELGNEGAGLGLAIVKKVVEKHNGKVYLSSKDRNGTTLSFTIPLKSTGEING